MKVTLKQIIKDYIAMSRYVALGSLDGILTVLSISLTAAILGMNSGGAVNPVTVGITGLSGGIAIALSNGFGSYIGEEAEEAKISLSTAVGVGGDPVTGESFTNILEKFENDPETEQIVMLGEIGGIAEVKAAKYAQENLTKPIISFIAGVSAPLGKRMGHAGAIIEGTDGTAQNKKELLKSYGVHVADIPSDIVTILNEITE